MNISRVLFENSNVLEIFLVTVDKMYTGKLLSIGQECSLLYLVFFFFLIAKVNGKKLRL